MAAQLIFDLPVRTALGREDFFVSPANALAVETLADPARWPDGKLLLVGPAGSGKTHLAGIWAAERAALLLGASTLPDAPPDAPALVVEDIQHAAGEPGRERRLLHLHNAALSRGTPLLLTSAAAPPALAVGLPDLASRLAATATARLHAPDDALLAALLVKLFADRQVTVPPALIPWLVTRIERSFAAARAAVAALDAAALSRGKPVTRALAAEVLDRGDAGPT